MMAILSGCIRTGEEAEIVDSSINLNINEPSADYVRRNASLIKVSNRPPGVHFYVARWDREKPGTANFDHGENAFSIENILSITAVEDSLSPQEGLVKFNVNAALAATDLIGHDEARKRFLSVLQNIRKAGWLAYFHRRRRSAFARPGDAQLRVVGILVQQSGCRLRTDICRVDEYSKQYALAILRKSCLSYRLIFPRTNIARPAKARSVSHLVHDRK